MTKRFRMIAGPNGSGKSTLTALLRNDYAVNFYTLLTTVQWKWSFGLSIPRRMVCRLKAIICQIGLMRMCCENMSEGVESEGVREFGVREL